MIPAKPTSYMGVKFRSKLEVQWAVFFDALKVEWKYEPKVFHLRTRSYLPDFWLPAYNLWAEVKPVKFSPIEDLLVRELAVATGGGVLLLVGQPKRAGHHYVKHNPDMAEAVQEGKDVVRVKFKFD